MNNREIISTIVIAAIVWAFAWGVVTIVGRSVQYSDKVEQEKMDYCMAHDSAYPACFNSILGYAKSFGSTN